LLLKAFASLLIMTSLMGTRNVDLQLSFMQQFKLPCKEHVTHGPVTLKK